MDTFEVVFDIYTISLTNLAVGASPTFKLFEEMA